MLVRKTSKWHSTQVEPSFQNVDSPVVSSSNFKKWKGKTSHWEVLGDTDNSLHLLMLHWGFLLVGSNAMEHEGILWWAVVQSGVIMVGTDLVLKI